MLRMLIPALNALYTISDQDLVDLVMDLYRSVAVLVICPAACCTDTAKLSNRGQQTTTTAGGSGNGMPLSAIAQGQEGGCGSNSSLIKTLQACLASGPAGPPPQQLGALIHAQLSGMLAAGPALLLLLPLLAGFQRMTGIRPLASASVLADLDLAVDPLLLGDDGDDGLDLDIDLTAERRLPRPATIAASSSAKAMLMAMLGTAAQVYLSASASDSSGCVGEEGGHQEAEELCACIQMLTEQDVGVWERSHKQCEQQQQQEIAPLQRREPKGSKPTCVALFEVVVIVIQVTHSGNICTASLLWRSIE